MYLLTCVDLAKYKKSTNLTEKYKFVLPMVELRIGKVERLPKVI